MLTRFFAVAGRKSHASLLTPFRSEGLQKRGRRKPIEEWARERCVRVIELNRSVFVSRDGAAAVCKAAKNIERAGLAARRPGMHRGVEKVKRAREQWRWGA